MQLQHGEHREFAAYFEKLINDRIQDIARDDPPHYTVIPVDEREEDNLNFWTFSIRMNDAEIYYLVMAFDDSGMVIEADFTEPEDFLDKQNAKVFFDQAIKSFHS